MRRLLSGRDWRLSSRAPPNPSPAELRAAESAALAEQRSAEFVVLSARLDAIRRSRAWRSASGYWRWRDRLRRGAAPPDQGDEASPSPEPARQTLG